jgi:hypothetical protein
MVQLESLFDGVRGHTKHYSHAEAELGRNDDKVTDAQLDVRLDRNTESHGRYSP